MVESMMPETEAQLEAAYTVHRLYNASAQDVLLAIAERKDNKIDSQIKYLSVLLIDAF